MTIQKLKITLKKMKMEEKVKPDWITDKQWAANPNIYHWEQERKGMESIKNSKPVTAQEAAEQFIRLRNSKSWSQGE